MWQACSPSSRAPSRQLALRNGLAGKGLALLHLGLRQAGRAKLAAPQHLAQVVINRHILWPAAGRERSGQPQQQPAAGGLGAQDSTPPACESCGSVVALGTGSAAGGSGGGGKVHPAHAESLAQDGARHWRRGLGLDAGRCRTHGSRGGLQQAANSREGRVAARRGSPRRPRHAQCWLWCQGRCRASGGATRLDGRLSSGLGAGAPHGC